MTTDGLLAGAATGVGPWPGTDGLEAARSIVGELGGPGGLPHLAELPARGLGADSTGRAAALLVDMPVDASPTGYRFADARGSVLRRARAHLARDLDFADEAFERAGLREVGGRMKVQVAGPVSVATDVELHTGRRALTDPGAARDVADSLAEGVRGHVDEVRRRLGVQPVLQLDEPWLPAALAGAVPGPTRFDPVRPLPPPEAESLLASVLEAVGDVPVLVDGCGLRAPLDLLRRLGVEGVSLPLCARSGVAGVDGAGLGGAAFGSAELDGLGAWLDSGRVAVLGLVPSVRPDAGDQDWYERAQPALDLVDRLGFARGVLSRQVLVAPEAGLAEADPQWARTALELAGRIATAFAEGPEDL